MAANFDMSKLLRMGSTAESSQYCSHCHRMVVMCSCSRGQVAMLNPAAFSDDNIFDVDSLDIESIEAEPYYGHDAIENAETEQKHRNDVYPRRQAAANPGSDLDVLAPMCEKSHQHRDFIDVDQFSVDHLPPSIKHHCTYVWIRNCVPLVVRLIVGNVAATGRACLISELRDKTIKCDLDPCPYSPHQHKLYGGIGIITNKHVVTNDYDAAETKIEFFYNNGYTRNQLMVTEYGTSMHTTNKRMDYTVFSCFVHNRELIRMVITFDKRRNSSWLAIPKEIREATRKYAIIISHPHGASKKISIGDFVEQEIRVESENQRQTVNILRSIFDICYSQGANGRDRLSEYMRLVPDINIPHTVTWYTTATCKGSSGAPVYMGNTVVEYGEEINQAHTHRGVDSAKGLNICFT